jgi:hypothetical protein
MWSHLLQVNCFRRFVVCVFIIEGKMVEELQFCFVFLMVLSDGEFDRDASRLILGKGYQQRT